MIINSPCKNCEKAGCGVYHDVCPAYQKYKTKKTKEYDEHKKKMQFRGDLDYIDALHSKRKRARRAKY